MTPLMRCLQAEIKKSRNSYAVWLSLAGTVANVLLFFGQHLLDGRWAAAGHPWTGYLTGFYEGISFMMLPLYVIILASLVTFLEHRLHTWVLLRTLPVHYWNLYWSKFLFMFFLFVGAHLLFIAGMLASGVLLGLLKPAYGLLTTWPDGWLLLELAGKTIVSVFGLMGLHYWLSLEFKHFIIPLTIGILGFVAVALLGPAWPYQWLIPYAPPALFMPAYRGEVQLVQWLGIDRMYWMSLFYGCFFIWLGYFRTRR